MAGGIGHFGGVKLRVTGDGDLLLTLYSLQEEDNYELADLTMATSLDYQPLVRANFRKEKAKLDLRVTELDEYFQISRIIIFYKPVATSRPG